MPVRTPDENLAIIGHYRDAADYSAPADEADVVMKGGITSGVVYPLALCELARTFRFRNVGGSSAGAIAAALAAAAEHARDSGGYRRLASLPADLGEHLPEMFQPSRRTQPLFEVFRAVQDKKRGGLLRVARLYWFAVSRQPLTAAAGAVAVAFVTAWALLVALGPPGTATAWRDLLVALLPALPLVLAGALLGALAGAVRMAFAELPRNGHGLCIGSNGAGAARPGTPPFTDWLHARLAEVSGVPVLTFGDLWGPAARDAFRLADKGTKESRDDALRALDPAVRLEMMTTNVSQRRPVRLPFVECVYMFCEDELRRWFPPDVVAQLETGGPAEHDGTPLHCPEHGSRLYDIPSPDAFPVVVAMRMSLSFPGLISAVPLWVLDFSRKAQPLKRCWFSDGGISSNFPIHFFDTLLPTRRTFAISLGPYPSDHQDQHVYYGNPKKVGGPSTIETETLGAFAAGVLDTMQNWSDVAQAQLSGYRDRVVEVRQRPDEGGMNIEMPRATILDLATRGRDAALELTRPVDGFDFDHHRTKRYNAAMAELHVAVERMARSWTVTPPGGKAYADLVSAGAAARTARLFAFTSAKTPRYDFTTKAPRPRPDLRIVARF